MNTSIIKEFAVFFTDGSIDREATHAKLQAELDEYELRFADDNGRIARAVAQVFSDNPGRHSQDYITMLALNVLQPQGSAAFAADKKAVMRFIKANAGERGKSLFNVKLGPGGGTVPWAFIPETEETAK